MPAQWPLFINNVSNKLASRTLKSTEEMGTFIANEYFNAVKTSQTPFGNLHESGSKTILEEGFKEAFKNLFDSLTPLLDEKMKDPKFADMEEQLPIPKIDANIDKELEACLATKTPYTFFDFGLPMPVTTKELKINKKKLEIEVPKITFNGFEGVAPYSFLYSIDGKVQPAIVTKGNKTSITIEPDSSVPGTFEYRLVSVSDATGHSKSIDAVVYVTIDSSEYDVPEVIEKTIPAKQLKGDELVELIVQRILFQNDDTKEFRRWVDRLEFGDNKATGKIVMKRVNEYLDKGIKSNIKFNKHKFQLSHEDDKNVIPSYMIANNIICKFTYVKSRDAISKTEHDLLVKSSNVFGFAADTRERNNNSFKYSMWETERERYRNDKIDCVNRIADSFKKPEEKGEDDPYNKLANAVINYWMSTVTKPFKQAPPIPPTMIPTPGIYAPIYYGNQKSLANNLRRALNTGKRFDKPPTIQVASKLVATALAVAFAKHLAELKFIYTGQIYVGVSTAPMVGIVPVVF